MPGLCDFSTTLCCKVVPRDGSSNYIETTPGRPNASHVVLKKVPRFQVRYPLDKLPYATNRLTSRTPERTSDSHETRTSTGCHASAVFHSTTPSAILFRHYGALGKSCYGDIKARPVHGQKRLKRRSTRPLIWLLKPPMNISNMCRLTFQV